MVTAVLGLLGFAGTAALGVLALVALGVLLMVRGPLSRREAAVAVLLGLIAAAAGVADGWAGANAAELAFGALQLPLVVLTLLAGWRLARRTGLGAAGAGPSLAVSGGAAAAVRGFGFGLALALPWALGNVVMGTPESDDMRTVWQPLAAALQPGVAEEAWARAFLIPALFFVFALTARPRTALVTAVIISTYWFAFLHAPTDPLFTVGVGTLYGLPILAALGTVTGVTMSLGLYLLLGFTVRNLGGGGAALVRPRLPVDHSGVRQLRDLHVWIDVVDHANPCSGDRRWIPGGNVGTVPAPRLVALRGGRLGHYRADRHRAYLIAAVASGETTSWFTAATLALGCAGLLTLLLVPRLGHWVKAHAIGRPRLVSSTKARH